MMSSAMSQPQLSRSQADKQDQSVKRRKALLSSQKDNTEMEGCYPVLALISLMVVGNSNGE